MGDGHKCKEACDWCMAWDAWQQAVEGSFGASRCRSWCVAKFGEMSCRVLEGSKADECRSWSMAGAM